MRPEGLARRLVEAGLLDPERVVEGDLVIRDASRRNRNARFESARGPSYFVKHATTRDGCALLDQEAVALVLLQGDARLAPHVPRLRLHLRDEGVLVTDLVKGAATLHEHHQRLRAFPPSLGDAMGRALARVHAVAVPPGALPPTIPPVFHLARPTLPQAREMSGGNRRLLEVLREFPDLPRGLDALAEEWRATRLVHGDLKWDNCLVAPPGEIVLADWESGGLGDPAWDVGSAFADYLLFWLASIPVAPEASPEEAAERAAFPLAAMGPAMRALWAAYEDEARLAPADARRLLERSVRSMAARLVQASFEHLQHLPAPTGTSILALQLAHNVLQRPRDAAAHLLTLPLQEVPA